MRLDKIFSGLDLIEVLPRSDLFWGVPDITGPGILVIFYFLNGLFSKLHNDLSNFRRIPPSKGDTVRPHLLQHTLRYIRAMPNRHIPDPGFPGQLTCKHPPEIHDQHILFPLAEITVF